MHLLTGTGTTMCSPPLTTGSGQQHPDTTRPGGAWGSVGSRPHDCPPLYFLDSLTPDTACSPPPPPPLTHYHRYSLTAIPPTTTTTTQSLQAVHSSRTLNGRLMVGRRMQGGRSEDHFAKVCEACFEGRRGEGVLGFRMVSLNGAGRCELAQPHTVFTLPSAQAIRDPRLPAHCKLLCHTHANPPNPSS